MVRLSGLVSRLAVTSFLTGGLFILCQADSTDFVPSAYAPESSGPNGNQSALWVFNYSPDEIKSAAKTQSAAYLYKSSLFDLGLSAKLGISSLSLNASAGLSTLYTLESWSQATAVKLTAMKGTTAVGNAPAMAVVGYGVQSSVLVQNASLSANVSTNAIGIGISVNAYNETLNVSALGFSTFVPFKLPVNPNGDVQFNQVRGALNQLFDDYMHANGSTGNPIILGFLVPHSLLTDGKNRPKDFDSIAVDRPS